MLSENIKTLRKQKGYSQEQLADKLNVVRQTVSKWEKGYSVPDADMLEKIADVFEVDVSDLLGKEISAETETTDIGELVKQLTILNEYMAERVRMRKKIKRIFKRLCSIICTIGILFSLYLSIGFVVSQREAIFRNEAAVNLTGTLKDEEYSVRITYWENNNEINSISCPNDAPVELKDILKSAESFDKAPEDLAKEIETYFTDNDGTCEIIYKDIKITEKIAGILP